MTQQTSLELRKFYQTLSGSSAQSLEPDSPFYVPLLENDSKKDPILKLQQRILWAESQSVDLLTGFRGNGKSTQLKRLKSALEHEDCHVVLADMTEYVLMTKPLEISDFIISLMAALATEVKKQQGLNVATDSYWERLRDFLQSKVTIDGLELDGGAAKLSLQLKTEPTIKQRIQDALRGHVTSLVEDARGFVSEVVDALRKRSGNPNKKIVFLVDSMEQVRGVGAEAEVVHTSVVNLFSGHAANLAFPLLHIVYTIPPFLIPLAPNAGRNLGGHLITAWPNVHVRHKDGIPDPEGLTVMRTIIEKRYPAWRNMFNEAQLDRLATSSGGDLREFFRLVRECLISRSISPNANDETDLHIPDDVLTHVEGLLRNNMLPIAVDDCHWLAKIHKSKSAALQNTAELPALARFFDGNLIMNYINGEPWYDIHPLLRDEIQKYTD